jgi:uncharacterized heparinase superfamily protein
MLYLEALRSARPRQLAARTLRPINRRRTRSSSMPRAAQPVEEGVALWRSGLFSTADETAADLPGGTVNVLGLRVPYPPEDWNRAVPQQLRRFHLHYGEEILGAARRGGEHLKAARAGLQAWVAANPPATNDAWHPYPLSTRIGNWIAAISLHPELAGAEVSESLWRQLAYLQRNVEDDILGNHVIRNARALVLGGRAFSEQRLVDRGIGLLERELPEQILGDGGHYERSPVYHAIVLRDLLEIRALVEFADLDTTIVRMEAFVAAMSRPDGLPASFNDSPLDLAPKLPMPPQPSGLTILADTGYAVVRSPGQLWLAFDCGEAAPRFLPSHAHADGLSFQLWLGNRPLVVDPGMSTYEPGTERNWLRGTRSHSTVAVDRCDQFELWGAFRAAHLASVEVLDVSGSDREGTIEAMLSGFPRVPGGIRHRRRLSWSSQTVQLEDELDGRGRHFVESALPLAPAVDVGSGQPFEADAAVIEPVGSLSCAVETRSISERLFEHVPAHALVMSGELQLPASIGWRISRQEGPA